MKIPANAKYAIIEQMLQREDNMLNIKWLCETAGVSRSGYYHYLQTADLREQREQQDRADFELILIAYNHRGYSKGARGIYMRFLHMDPPVHMNIKKIRRLMKKYGLFCPVRKANPYRRMAKALRTDAVADNLLKREFEEHGPRTILLTDITYIIWVLSESLEIDFVLETVEIAIANYGIEMNTETMIHSDQGAHYTSVQFRSLLKDKELRQSMSRRANCWDNAPQESFYGHMKDEIDISECETYEQILAVITDWADYYNNERYQWDLAKLAPAEYYKYLKTGKYPLEIPKSNGQK